MMRMYVLMSLLLACGVGGCINTPCESDSCPPGPKGERGAIGPQGKRGERGEQGLRGSRGETGPRGRDGSMVVVTQNNKKYSLGATFVGPAKDEQKKMLRVSGDIGGWTGVKKLCEKSYGPAAHLCTVPEIHRSLQLGLISLPKATELWVAGSGGYYETPVSGGNKRHNHIDCYGWRYGKSAEGLITIHGTTLSRISDPPEIVESYILSRNPCGFEVGVACCR